VKILALTHRLPYAPNRGDRIRSYHVLRTLAQQAEVHLFSFAEQGEACHLPSMQSWLRSVTIAVPRRLVNYAKGAATLVGRRPLTHTLLDARGADRTLAAIAGRIEPDVILAYCSGMARFAVDGPLRALPCVVDMVDVDSAKWAALSGTASVPMRWIYRREARELGAFEVRACRHAASTLVVNARERDTLAAMAPGAAIAVVENGVDLDFFASQDPPAASLEVVFCGVMDYPPNIDGVVWFAHRVWPAVRDAVPGAAFTIVGARPAAAVQQLAAIAGISVTGAVPDVRPFLWRAAVSVAPLHTARGIQNKVLEALAAGLPVVATRAVGEGLPVEALPGCRILDEEDGWRRHVLELLRTPAEERRRISARSQLSNLTWRARLAAVPDIVAAAAAGAASHCDRRG
jgi:sugar transferase (PEP-CTERM/EpsH1 system associated)